MRIHSHLGQRSLSHLTCYGNKYNIITIKQCSQHANAIIYPNTAKPQSIHEIYSEDIKPTIVTVTQTAGLQIALVGVFITYNGYIPQAISLIVEIILLLT